MPAIVSVHVPKSGGVSFKNWLDAALGVGRTIWDYGDGVVDPAAEMNVDPLAFLAKHASGPELPEGALAVHGHFWVEKYRAVKDALRICFLREPVQRTISNYFYWKTINPQDHELLVRFRAEDWSLMEFARQPQMRYFYRDQYFRGNAIDQFDFIGDMAHYDDEVARLERLTGLRGDLPVRNRNTFDGYDAAVEDVLSDAALVASLRELLSADIDFYERHAGR